MMTDFDPTMNENKLQISLFDEQKLAILDVAFSSSQ
jgi:hypothetical protein